LLQVCAEFAELHRQLTDVAGVNVKLFQHHLSHGTPDAVFPNNWFSTHAAGEQECAKNSSRIRHVLLVGQTPAGSFRH
jgi:hypothetical protein